MTVQGVELGRQSFRRHPNIEGECKERACGAVPVQEIEEANKLARRASPLHDDSPSSCRIAEIRKCVSACESHSQQNGFEFSETTGAGRADTAVGDAGTLGELLIGRRRERQHRRDEGALGG